MFGKIIHMRRFNLSFDRNMLLYLLIITLVVLKMYLPDWERQGYQSEPRTDADRAITAINDSLPHYEYEKKADSIKLAFHQKESPISEAWEFAFIGISKRKKDSGKSYFFELKGYRLEYVEELVTYHQKNGKNLIEYWVWDRTDEQGTKWGHKETKEVSVVFEEDQFADDKEKAEGKLLFPSNKTIYNIIKVSLTILIALLIVLLGYNLIIKPLGFLLRVARGDAFADRNIRTLYAAAWTLIIIGLAPGILRIILHLAFKPQIPEWIGFSYWHALLSYWGFLLAGLIALLFADAFRKGNKLEKDQELTV